MKSGEHLYLIALIPPDTIIKYVTELKEYFKKKYNAGHALKSPPHITLIPPFRWPQADENLLISTIGEFCKNEKPFKISLKDFGAFPPRVIFVKIKDNPMLTDLYARFIISMDKLMDILKEEKRIKRFNPHITLATRDLSKENFHEAWKEFRYKSFSAEYMNDKIVLLKHNGKNWEIFHHALFGKK